MPNILVNDAKYIYFIPTPSISLIPFTLQVQAIHKFIQILLISLKILIKFLSAE